VFNSKEMNTEVFRDFSFEFEEEKIYTVIGPSGCGKSTLIRIILGLELPDKGELKIDGITSNEYQKTNQIGVVFQKASFFPWKTVFQNILFPIELSNKKVSKNDVNYGLNLLKKFNIEETGNSYIHELSGGMQQRANVARALVMNPKLLILDEPFNAVDEFTREKLWEEFRRVWKNDSLTVILISHDIREAVFFADEVLILPQKPILALNAIKINLPFERDLKVLSSEGFFLAIQSVRRNLNFEHVQ
jgi:NitT/TauT family transport system ATP-binding protein